MATLPLARWPTNRQPVNFSPIDNALANIARTNAINRDTEIKQDAGARIAAGDTKGAENELFNAGYLDQGINLQNTAATQKRNAAQDQALVVNRAGGIAQMGLKEADPTRKAAFVNRIYALDPNMQKHIADAGIDINNPDAVLGYVQTEAAGYKGYQDPEDVEAKTLGNQKTRAEISALNNKDQTDAIFAKMLAGEPPNGAQPSTVTPQSQPSPPSQQHPQPPATLQPQSFESAPSQPMLQQVNNVSPTQGGQSPPPQPQQSQLNPGVVLTGNETTPEDAESAQGGPTPQVPSAVYSLPGNEVVQTPLGSMSRDQARKIGAFAALKGKGDFGKMMIDAASGGNGGLSKAATTSNDKDEIGATNQLATLNSIKDTYQSKFLNIPTRFKLWGAALADKVGALNPQDKQDLQQYAQFRQASWHNLNRVLKDLSGTAVTGNELERQLNDLPNPGTGLFDGDSPAQFEAKLNGSIAYVSSAVARSRYLRSQGFTGKPWEAGIAVEDMPQIINQRGLQLQQQLQQQFPKANPMQLQKTVTQKIKQEFGI